MSISSMLCAVFFALLGSAIAGPIDADLQHNVDLGSLQKERLTNPATDEAEIALLEAGEEHLVEGDILLTNAQLTGTFHESNRTRRQAVKDKEDSWESAVIPYNYSSTYPRETLGPTITAAMQFWEKNTCVQFREVTSGYRVLIRDLNGCASQVGNTHFAGGYQSLYLAKECMQIGDICHELMHTFGFHHTQTRFDRDKYIDIDVENLLDWENYNMVDNETHVLHDIPYEFGSVMHYYQNDVAIDARKPVIYAKPAYKIYQESMQGRMPTFLDILAVNRHFNCSAKCKTSVKCANGGVQDVNNCNKCLCPIGWTGDKCKERPHNTTQIDVTSELMTKIISINSTILSTTVYNVTYYLLKAPAGMKVQMTPRVVGNRRFDKKCSLVGIEVKFLKNQRRAGLQVCNHNKYVKYPTITSETNVMLVQAYTLGHEIDVELHYVAVKSPEKCNMPVGCVNGGVQDVNNCNKCICPVGWVGNMCDIRPEHTVFLANTTLEKTEIRIKAGEKNEKYYLIKAPAGMKVQMTFEVQAARMDSSCISMGVEVKYLADQSPAGLRVCDWKIQPTVISETNEMLVQLYTLAYTDEEEVSAELQFKAVNFTEECKTSVECANGGVPDANVCNRCICPLGWTGYTCDKRPEHTRIFAKNESKKVTIRMPFGPPAIQHRVEYYLITAPAGMKVQMTPIVSDEYSESCDITGLKVKFVRDQLPVEIRVCPSTVPPKLISDTNEMLVQAYTREDAFAAQLKFQAVN